MVGENVGLSYPVLINIWLPHKGHLKATKAKNLTEEDCKSLLKIVTLLRQTTDKGFILFTNSNEYDEKIYITAMVDAAYISHKDAWRHMGYSPKIL